MSEEELRAFVLPDESAFDLLSRTLTEPIPSGVFFLGSLRAGQVLELAGASGTAKSEVLIQVALQSILPVQASGCAENVLLLDLDAKFDPLRLIQALHARISSQLEPADRDIHLQGALERFHLIQCRSSYDLLATLKTVVPLIKRLQEAGGLRLILMDNIAAQYWVDKARKPPPSALPSQSASIMTLHAVHAAAAFELRQILATCRCAAVVTKHNVVAAANTSLARPAGGPQASVLDPHSSAWTTRDFLPQAWQDLVSHRVALRLLSSPSLATGSRFAAKWLEPDHDHIYTFHVTDAALQPG